MLITSRDICLGTFLYKNIKKYDYYIEKAENDYSEEKFVSALYVSDLDGTLDKNVFAFFWQIC